MIRQSVCKYKTFLEPQPIKWVKWSLTFIFSTWNIPLCLPLCSSVFLITPHFRRVLGSQAHQPLGVIFFFHLLFRRLMWVYLDWAHHRCFSGGRRRLGDQVQPGLSVLGEWGGGALRCHRTDGRGEWAVGFTGDCGGVRWRQGALKDKHTTVRCNIVLKSS